MQFTKKDQIAENSRVNYYIRILHCKNPSMKQMQQHDTFSPLELKHPSYT